MGIIFPFGKSLNQRKGIAEDDYASTNTIIVDERVGGKEGVDCLEVM